MRAWLTSSLIVLGVAAGGPAWAGLRAHVECTPDGGQPVVRAAKVALDKSVSCEIVIDGGKLPTDATATIAASWESPVGPVVGAPRAALGRARPDLKAAYRSPGAFSPGTDFMTCAKVSFDGQVTAGDKVVWKGALKLAGSCDRARPVPAKLTCMATDENMHPLPYPGAGSKQKPELSEGLTCTIAVTGEGGGSYGVFAVHHAKAPPIVRPVTQPAQARTPFAFTQLLAPAVPKCRSFVVDGALLRGDGASLWTGHLAIPQVCKHR